MLGKIKTQTVQISALALLSLCVLSLGAWFTFKSPINQEKSRAVLNSPQKGEFFGGTENSNPNISSNTQLPQTQDSDKDGLTDEEERRYGTNPYLEDTDGDGKTDGEEVRAGYSPTQLENSVATVSTPFQPNSDPNADDDQDGLSNALEEQYKTDPKNPDTDQDGYLDGAEVQNGYDPTNPLPVKLSNTQASTSSAILFYGEGCPHCAVVEEYISQNGVREKMKLEEKEIYNNEANLNELIQVSNTCGIPQEQAAVPLLFVNNQCLSGEADITNYFKNILGNSQVALNNNAGQVLASSSNNATNSSTTQDSQLTTEEMNMLNAAEPKALPEIADSEIILNNQNTKEGLIAYFQAVEGVVKDYLVPLQEGVAPGPVESASTKALIIDNVTKGYNALKQISTPSEAKDFQKLTLSIFKAYENLTDLNQSDFASLAEFQSEALNQILGLQLALGEFNKQGQALADKYGISL